MLVQVKTTKWPGSVEMTVLEEFEVPPNVTKLIHRWRLRASEPDVRKVS